MNTTIKVKNKKYVYIEAVLNKENKCEVISGLFKGIVENNNVTFVILNGPGESIRLLSLKFYDLMTIEVLEDTYKTFYYLRALKSEQEEAFTVLKGLYADLKEHGFAMDTDPSIIDINKYTDVPQDYKDCKAADASINISAGYKSNHVNAPATKVETPSYVRNGGYRMPTYGNSSYNYGTATPAKEPEPKVFGRVESSKKPSKDALITLMEKLDLIKADQYVPVIATVPNDNETAVTKVEDDDPFDRMSGMYEGMCG